MPATGKQNDRRQTITAMGKEEFGMLEEIFRQQVFEMYENEDEILIPYMMNDAIECYLVLKDCRMTGRYLPEMSGKTEAAVRQEKEEYCMVVRQGIENVFTIWFRAIEKVQHCYQYHRIGHFWVKGQEQWRQLVYMIGTVYDKYRYIGKEVCNEQELSLISLMEFAPFRYFSPIRESLDQDYPDTMQGAMRMEELAIEAKDSGFAKLVRQYQRWPSAFLKRQIIKKMEKPSGERLYRVIWEKTAEASGTYPDREYDASYCEKMKKERERLEERLKAKGFSGVYPDYQKGTVWIHAAEEHPFTLMEWEEFQYRIQLMVSEYRAVPDSFGEWRNGGFFKGKGRNGYIVKDLEEHLDALLEKWK